MLAEERCHERGLEIRKDISPARHPTAEVLDSLNILLGGTPTVATALQVLDVWAEHDRQRSALQSMPHMRPPEKFLDHST